jgi:hypothetical protein
MLVNIRKGRLHGSVNDGNHQKATNGLEDMQDICYVRMLCGLKHL